MKCPPAHYLALILAAAAAATVFGPDRDESAPIVVVVVPGVSHDAQLRSAAKTVVAADATAGRLTLFAAAALFRELDLVPPAVPPSAGYHPHLSGATAEERFCRQVIHWAGPASA